MLFFVNHVIINCSRCSQVGTQALSTLKVCEVPICRGCQTLEVLQGL
jgi:hypothetical protein